MDGVFLISALQESRIKYCMKRESPPVYDSINSQFHHAGKPSGKLKHGTAGGFLRSRRMSGWPSSGLS